MHQYFVHANLNHDGKAYVRGDVVSLSEEAAAPLLRAGVVSTEAPAVPVVAPSNARIQSPEEKERLRKKDEPSVGGTQVKTGEPSLDTRPEDAAARMEPTDVSATVDEPEAHAAPAAASEKALADMNRAELNATAIARGVSEDAIKAAPTKAAVIELIEMARAPKEPAVPPAPAPEQDLAADL